MIHVRLPSPPADDVELHRVAVGAPSDTVEGDDVQHAGVAPEQREQRRCGGPVSVAFANWSEARGSVVQLLLNVAILIMVGAAGIVVQQRVWGRVVRRATDTAGRRRGHER